MSAHIYLAPAAAGKTAYVLDRVCPAAQAFSTDVRVLVPSGLQARAWRRRLAEAGGTLGVRVQTFDQLYDDLLLAAGQAYTELSEPVQYRLLQAVVDDLPLVHYASLTHRPGFIHLLQGLISELKAARIQPEQFSLAVVRSGHEARLTELADIYASYQERLQQHNWADRAGRAWLAVEVLAADEPAKTLDKSMVVVDGFDNFTEVQIGLLKRLASAGLYIYRCMRMVA